MADKAPAASASRGSIKPVASLNSNDVLLGRGTGSNQYIGNQRFRDIVEERKEEYNSTRRHKPKARIAKEVLDCIHSLGGRFLRLDEDSYDPADESVEEGTWYVVDDKTALEKVKQTLRQQREPSVAARLLSETSENTQFPPPPAGAAALPMAPSSDSFGVSGGTSYVDSFGMSMGPSLVTSNLMTVQSPTLVGSTASATFDARLLLSRGDPFAFSQFNQALLNPGYTPGLSQAQLPVARLAGAQPDLPFSGNPDDTVGQQRLAQLRDLSLVQSQYDVSDSVQENTDVTGGHSGDLVLSGQESSTKNDVNMGVASMPKENASAVAVADDDNVSDFLLSILALSGRTKFTEQQDVEEKANMTNEERAKLLSDLFGKYCTTHQSKKARRDLDKDSIAFLVRQMRVEIERIPDRKKQALMEAQRVCRAEEFSDTRLEHFLRCVGMDVELAAQRFVNYWQCRREVFGPEKYLMRMTLSEALRDDLVALETCVFCLLPRLEVSGRQVLYLDPSRHTREGYTSESLLRAIWYVIEVTSESNNDIRSSAVQVIWFRDMTIWDYDAKIYDRMHYFEASAWPIRKCAFHVCCAPSFAYRILKPILFALADKESRLRILFHDVPECKIIETMSSYGITKDMLPTDMGGSLEFDQSEWIANRRAAELEEI